MSEINPSTTESMQQRAQHILLPILKQGFGSPDQAAEIHVNYLTGKRREYKVPPNKFSIVVSIENGSGGIAIFVQAEADGSSFRIYKFEATKYSAFKTQTDEGKTNLILEAVKKDPDASSNLHLLEEVASEINSNNYTILYKDTDAKYSGLR